MWKHIPVTAIRPGMLFKHKVLLGDPENVGLVISLTSEIEGYNIMLRGLVLFPDGRTKWTSGRRAAETSAGIYYVT